MRTRAALALLIVSVTAGCGTTHHHSVPMSGQREYSTPFGPSPHAPGFGHENIPVPPGSLFQRPGATVEMFDTITLDTVPSDARVLAGYTGGSWPTYLPLKRRFPRALVKSIAISRHYNADCLDIEPGDARPSDARAWYYAQRARHIKPCLYDSLSAWGEVFANLRGIPRSSYWAWDAHYDYFAHIDAGFDGTQWTDRARNSNLDESTITLAFAGIHRKAVCDAACRRHKRARRLAREHAHLRALYRERAALRVIIRRLDCRHRTRHPHACHRILRRGDAVNAQIRRLHARHIY